MTESRKSAFRPVLLFAWLTILAATVVAQSIAPTSEENGQEIGQAKSQAAKPELNEKFTSDDLKIEEWLGRFEVESREVFAAQAEVLKAVAISPGDSVADVGAGTGLYTRAFAAAANEGWVYAVDISPKFLAHIRERTDQENTPNVSTVLCSQTSINLPPASVEVVFVCDTYHHFESPQATLASIHSALKPGGKLIVVDFERIPGESREWIIDHVRAGKQEFRQEIEAAKFAFVGEIPIAGFEENYLLEFSRR